MPTISQFYGLLVRMNFRKREHNPPHIHVFYGDQECTINLLTCTIGDGKLSPRAAGMAIEWTMKNRDKLIEMWETGNISKLPPLE